ncbi:MAG: type I restriction-modification system subunit M N-terminal domain-containing protein [Pseudomonadota bacterium]|nr:type I restriction-modification system subunit M N-terminal domain-containing protein [Pseudomonadota bacterium]
MGANFNELSSFVWSVAVLLRGDYKQSDYGKVILPFTLLRRMDCVLEKTKPAVLQEYESRKNLGIDLTTFLTRKAGQSFYNTSPFDFPRLLGDPAHIKANLTAYINAFRDNSRDIFERYGFFKQLEKLDDNNLLFLIVQKFFALSLKQSQSNLRYLFKVKVLPLRGR